MSAIVMDSTRLDQGRSFDELADSGLLWLFNSTALWPRGFAFGLVFDDGKVVGWDVSYDGTEPVITSGPEHAQARFDAVEAILAEARLHPEGIPA